VTRTFLVLVDAGLIYFFIPDGFASTFQREPMKRASGKLHLDVLRESCLCNRPVQKEHIFLNHEIYVIKFYLIPVLDTSKLAWQIKVSRKTGGFEFFDSPRWSHSLISKISL